MDTLTTGVKCHANVPLAPGMFQRNSEERNSKESDLEERHSTERNLRHKNMRQHYAVLGIMSSERTGQKSIDQKNTGQKSIGMKNTGAKKTEQRLSLPVKNDTHGIQLKVTTGDTQRGR